MSLCFSKYKVGIANISFLISFLTDDDDEPPAKKPRVENGTNEQNGLSRNVLASNSTYPQGRMNTPSPLARRREPRRTDYPGEDRPGTLLSSYVPAPGHIAMVHPLHNVIIEVPQDLPILLQGPAISEGSGRGDMQDPERLQRIENFKARIARQLEYARDQAMAYELRSEEESEAGPSGQ